MIDIMLSLNDKWERTAGKRKQKLIYDNHLITKMASTGRIRNQVGHEKLFTRKKFKFQRKNIHIQDGILSKLKLKIRTDKIQESCV